MSVTFTHPTALLLIDNQAAFTIVPPSQPCHWGSSRSNPSYESNISTLLTAFRTARTVNPNIADIIHIFHASTTPTSPLHPSAPGNGIAPAAFATPLDDGSEPVMWKSVNSAFVGTDLEKYLRGRGIRQLVVAGMTTDHCVSTSVRMAANLGVVDRRGENGEVVEKGGIILVSDATATWAKGGFNAETVHGVTVASLEGEFADVCSTAEVVGALQRL